MKQIEDLQIEFLLEQSYVRRGIIRKKLLELKKDGQRALREPSKKVH